MIAEPLPLWPVRRFATWWLREKPFAPPHGSAVRHIGYEYSGVTLYRHGQFQVQLFIGKPGAKVIDHAHPNVDSVEMRLSGNGEFWTADHAEAFGMLRVDANEVHGARAGDEGHAFFSFQKWLNSVPPSSVELDWQGEPLDEQHARELSA